MRLSSPTPRSLRQTLVLAALVVVATLAGPSALRAQSAHDERVQEALGVVEVWLDAQMAYEEIPSLQAAVVHDQELVRSWVMGMAHREAGEAATPETLYSICSISKLFTSVAAMRQRDAGAFELEDEVRDILPWFTLDQQFPDSPPITVEGILTHSAGLPRESDHPYWTGPDFPFPTRDQIIEGLTNQETLYPARQYFQYSNLGLTLVGEIVQETSGMDYHAYVREHVLDPLGMEDTYSDIPAEHRGARLATGYSAITRSGGREEVAFFQANGIAPAAGYASTATDLAKFASWNFRNTGSAEEVLHAHTLDEMQRVHYVDPGWNTFWGLGFSVMRRGDKTFVGHGGSCPGFRSHLMLHTGEKIGTVFMANAMINSNKFTAGIYDLVQEALNAAAKEDEEGEEEHEGPPMEHEMEPEHQAMHDAEHAGDDDGLDLAPYLGAYSDQPWGGESAVVRWKGGLATLSLPTDNPLRALTRYRHVEGDVFRRVRDDGELAEALIFERSDDGEVTGYRVHGQLSPRVR